MAWPKPPKPAAEPAAPKPVKPRALRKAKRDEEAGGLTPVRKALIDAMVWQGLTRNAAAELVGVDRTTAWRTFRSPECSRYYNEQVHALRLSERSRNVHRLAEIRDSDRNLNASVNAVRTLESLTDGDDRHAPTAPTPGYVIVLPPSTSPMPWPTAPIGPPGALLEVRHSRDAVDVDPDGEVQPSGGAR
jgi:hypothetical protein